jgi:glycosyltransferase involved in cell wall biosynthesis
MSRPSISVVIPAYNAEDTITEALDSVCLQTVKPTTIFVIDDVSTDSTRAIVRKYIAARPSGTPPAIHLIEQQKNGGPAAARNAGIAASNDEWIAFLDGDDVWLLERIEVQLHAAKANPEIAFICSPTLPLTKEIQKANTREQKSKQETEREPEVCSPMPDVSCLELRDFIYSNPVATSTVLVKRKVLRELSCFDEQFRGPEDYDLWLRIVEEHKAIKTEAPLSLYRYVAGSLSMDDRTFLPQVLAVLEKAFSPDGALHAYAGQRRRAYAEKYSSASWMAYNRGDRRTAFRHLARSYMTYTGRIYPEERDPLLRVKLIFRYLGLYSGEGNT